MAKLVFHVQADYEEVIKLRNEIDKLKKELKSMDATRSPASFNALNSQLSASTHRMEALVSSAAKVGAEMETGFKRKIFDASQAVNGFTEKIIAQKTVVKDVEYNVKRLGDAYRIALKRNPLSASGKLEEYNAARRALDEEKASLFGLTQQQAEARLSVKKLRDEYALYKDDVKDVVNANEGFAISWKKALAIIGGVGVLKALGSEIVRVRGEFQSTQTAIETLVGKDMAGNLIPQIKELAKISPLTMSDMVGAEKMMLGFNIQAEDTIKYLKALSDVSMGDSQRFNSLTLAFSQMSAAGKLMGQDLNQMINAGFNPLQIMADKTGKSISTLKEEMAKGAISAEMVQQAFIDATSAGGKFYNMSENASKTINGQLSMMQDAINTVFNELGTKSEGVIMDGIQMTTSLIQNYETVGKVLTGLVVTYGAYRTAVMLVTAAESKHTLVEIGLTNARILARKAQLALNAAMLTNPYVAVATVVIGLTSAMWALHDSSTETEKAQRRFNEQQEEAAKQAQEHKQKIDALIQSSRDIALSDLQRGENLAALRSEYPKIFAQYDIETIKLADILKLKQQIAEEDAKRVGEKQAKNLSDIESEIKYYENLLKTLSGQQGVDGYVKKLKELRSTRNVMLQEKGKSISEQFISSLKDIDISEFDRYISELEKRIKGQGENGSIKLRLPIDVKGSLSDEAIYKVKDIKTLIDTAKSTKQTRIESEKNKTTYQQDYEKAKKDWEEAKKKLSEIEKDKSKFTSKQYEEAKKRADTTQKAYKDLGGVTGGSLTKQENQAQIKQQERLSDQLLSLRRKNQQNEINLMAEGTEKKLAQIDLDYQKELDAIRKQEQEWTKANGGILTQEQSAQISLSYSQAENKRDKSISDVNKEELEAMNRYLKEYGTFLQKKEAITKEYNDKIAKATTEGDKRMLQKEMAEAIQNIDLSELKKGMNWEQVFGNLDKVSTDTLKKLKANLKDFISSQKDLSPENLKELVDAIERIDEKVSERNPFEAMTISFKSLKNATDAQREAQEAYNKALKEGTDEEKKNAKSTLESAKNNKQKALSEATTALHKGVEEIGQYVDAGNQVIGIMETLGVKTPEWLEGTMSGFGEMLNGLERIDLTKPMSIVTGGLQTIKGALTSVVSLGGLIPGFGGADYSRYNKMKEEYDTLVDVWDTLISKKQQYIDISYGDEARKVGQETLDLLDKKAKSNVTLGLERLNAGASIGSHSIGVRQRKGMSKEGWDELRKAAQSIGFDYNSVADDRMTGLFDLTADQLSELQDEAPTFWAKLDGDVQEYLQNVIDCNTEIESMKDKLNETMTGVSFDSFYDSFISTLSDMDKSSKDMADDFGEYLKTAILSNLVANKYRDKIEALYNDWASKSDSDDDGIFDLTAEESEQLKAAQRALAEQMMAERDAMANAFGWNSGKYSQSSSKGGFQAMSQDTGSELNGRFTALQMAGEEIKSQNALQSQSLNILTMKADAILSVNTETRNIADDTRDLIANSYLELVQISENTGAIVKPIQQIQKDIAEVKKNTSKL